MEEIVYLICALVSIAALVCFFVLCSNVARARRDMMAHIGMVLERLDRAAVSAEGLALLDGRNGFRGITLGSPLSDHGPAKGTAFYGVDGVPYHYVPGHDGSIGGVGVTGVYAARSAEGQVAAIRVHFHGRHLRRMRDVLEAAYGRWTECDPASGLYGWEGGRVCMALVPPPASGSAGYLHFSVSDRGGQSDDGL